MKLKTANIILESKMASNKYSIYIKYIFISACSGYEELNKKREMVEIVYWRAPIHGGAAPYSQSMREESNMACSVQMGDNESNWQAVSDRCDREMKCGIIRSVVQQNQYLAASGSQRYISRRRPRLSTYHSLLYYERHL